MEKITGDPPYEYSDSIDIAATPDAVYALVSDLPRMGEWSPENRGGRWLRGGSGRAGDWFEGTNSDAHGEWTAECEVVSADPGREFSFAMDGVAANHARWTFRMEPTDDGTRLTQMWQLPQLNAYLAESADRLESRLDKVPRHIRATLEGIKATAESGAD